MNQSLVDSKKDYLRILQDIIAIPVASRLYSIYKSCKGLKDFQVEIAKVPQWNNHMIETEIEKIEKISGCDCLERLIKVTITTSVKIKVYEYRKNLNRLDIKVPSKADFVHKCFVNASQFAWKNSHLFVEKNLRNVEIQNNMNILETNVRKCVSKSVLDFIDVKSILMAIEDLEMPNKKKQFRKSKRIYSEEAVIHKAEQQEVAEADEEKEVEEAEEEQEADEVDEEAEEADEVDEEAEVDDDDDEENDDDEEKEQQEAEEQQEADVAEEQQEAEEDNNQQDDDIYDMEPDVNEVIDPKHVREVKYEDNNSNDSEDSEDSDSESVHISSSDSESETKTDENVKVVSIKTGMKRSAFF